MSCRIVYSHRIMGVRFGVCAVHGWAGRWRWWGRERRDARRHVQVFAGLDGVPPEWTEEVTTDPRPTVNWRVVFLSMLAGAVLSSALIILFA